MGFARLYTLPIPFAGYELFDIGYEQSADVMYLTHVSHKPQKLSRYAEAVWTIDDVVFGTNAVAPTGLAVTAYGSTSDPGYSPQTYSYVVTTVDATTGQESVIGATATCTNDLGISGHYNVVTWSAVANAERYNLYRASAGSYGYIGSTTVLTFSDTNFGPDTTNTPPQNRQPFATDNYPARVTLDQQRAVFGRTNTHPAGIYTSKSADLENLDTSFPLRADDAITLQLVARQVNAIEWMVSLNRGLVIGTRDAIFSLTGSQGGPLVANDAPDIRVQSYRGASKVRPATIDDTIFYEPVKGGGLRTLGYTFENDGYKGNDITVYAPHFFRGFNIVDMAWAEYPTSTLWCVRNDGRLVVLTWQAEQNVWGWSLCEMTDGFIESVAVINYNGEDIAYFVVRREVNGATRKYIERIGRTNWTDYRQATFLDSALTYSGAPTSGLVGFRHLEGLTVDALCDGFHMKGLTVTGGRVTFPAAFSQITVGLPYGAYIETLPATLAQTPVQGRYKQTRSANISVLNSCGLTAGTSESDRFDLRSYESLPQAVGAPTPITDILQLDASARWDNDATIFVSQDGPYPMTILGIFPETEVGG